MSRFSADSLAKLKTCHSAIQEVLVDASWVLDFAVIFGHRSAEEQHRLFLAGKSKKDSGHSLHERAPSLAVDIAPWPIDWQDINRFRVLAGVVLGVAHARGIALRWGGDWNRNWDEKDEHGLRDFGHFELIG